MFPFERPKNYGEMLNKIGMFTLITGFMLTLLIRHYSPALAGLLAWIIR